MGVLSAIQQPTAYGAVASGVSALGKKMRGVNEEAALKAIRKMLEGK